MKFEHPFVFICFGLIVVVLNKYLWNSSVTVETKLAAVLFLALFTVFFVFVLNFLEKLDNQAWRVELGFE